MHGSGKEEIEFQYMNDRGDVVIRKHPFEGILNNMARVIKKRNPCLCAKNWRKISVTALVQIVVVHVFALRLETCISVILTCHKFQRKALVKALSFPRTYFNRSKSTNCRKNPERDQRAVRILSECRLKLSFPFSLSRDPFRR